MRRFSFSLEAVLTVRQKALEDERIKLASILSSHNKQKEILETLKNNLSKLESENEENLNSGVLNPDITSCYSAYCAKLSDDIKKQIQLIETIEKSLKIQQEAAKEAYIKVKALEKLKEKQKENYDKEFLLEEFKTMDDIVNSKRISA